MRMLMNRGYVPEAEYDALPDGWYVLAIDIKNDLEVVLGPLQGQPQLTYDLLRDTFDGESVGHFAAEDKLWVIYGIDETGVIEEVPCSDVCFLVQGPVRPPKFQPNV